MDDDEEDASSEDEPDVDDSATTPSVPSPLANVAASTPPAFGAPLIAPVPRAPDCATAPGLDAVKNLPGRR